MSTEKAEYLPKNGAGSLPFSEAVKAGNMLYLSGTLGFDPETGKLVPGGIQEETKQMLENMKRKLEKYGSSMDKVIKCVVMIADIKEIGDMNSVYVTYFPVNKPARSTFGVSGLAFNARVEIECIAMVE